MPELESGFKLSLHVSAWAAWAGPELSEQAHWRSWAFSDKKWDSHPKLSAPVACMPPLQRRRADFSDRLGLEVAFRLAPPGSNIPSVFASRHGQLARSTAMLQAQAGGEFASPMDFSLSVHNATAGQFAITTGNRSSSNSIAACEESFTSALLEAQGLVWEGNDNILVVMSDPFPPPIFQGHWNGEPAGYGLGLLLGSGGGDRFELSFCDAAGKEETIFPQALTFLETLAGGKSESVWQRGGRRWKWTRL